MRVLATAIGESKFWHNVTMLKIECHVTSLNQFGVLNVSAA